MNSGVGYDRSRADAARRSGFWILQRAPCRGQRHPMTRVSRQPLLLALLVAGVFCSPVTYQGGSAAAHPHMFLQLWHDAASGSFSHHAAVANPHDHQAHAGHLAPAPLTASERPADRPTLAAFVVSGWSQSAMLAPSHQVVSSRAWGPVRHSSRQIVPADRFDAPEPPPPRFMDR